MKRVLSIACLLFSFALAVSLSAQAPTAGMKIASDADYATHMKEIGQLNGVLNKSIKGGVADEATKAATRMEVLFKNIHTYWNMARMSPAPTPGRVLNRASVSASNPRTNTSVKPKLIASASDSLMRQRAT